MSQRAYKKFREALVDDAGLAEKFRARLAEAGETGSVDATVAFAQRHGFDVQAADVRRARAEE